VSEQVQFVFRLVKSLLEEMLVETPQVMFDHQHHSQVNMLNNAQQRHWDHQ
jgi:hypothetical protein